MASAIYNCGCSHSSCMYSNKILSVDFCFKHFHLLDDNKSLRELASIMRGVAG